MENVMFTAFEGVDTMALLGGANEVTLDGLDFGVIGFDAACTVCRFNTFESKAAGLSVERVVGKHLFNVVAPCMNNFLVAQRFEEAVQAGSSLDVMIDYVLTLKMRPTKVKLRLLATPGAELRYVLVQRKV